MTNNYLLLKFIVLAGSLVALITAVNLSQAQEQMDAQAYLERKQAAISIFFDKSLSQERRLAVVRQLGYADKEIATKLFNVGKDKTEPDAIRLAALKKHRYEENWFNLLLSSIADPGESDELASGLIRQLSQRTTFKQPVEIRQQLQSVLRDRLDDPRKQTRLEAFRTLVASHDQVAIDKLIEGLRSGSPVVPLADSINLLDLDGSTKHISTLRPFLSHSDIDVRAEAARALTVDPESRSKIVEWVTDINVNQKIRLKAMRGLAREDESFMSYVLKIALSSDESADIRYAAIENAMRRLNYQSVSAQEQIALTQAVERLTAVRGVVTSSGKDLGVEAKKLLAYLQKNFPVIKRHYNLKQFTLG